MLDVSQAAELKMAFRRHGWTNADIKTLSEGDLLGKVLMVIKKRAEIVRTEHLIDCSAPPFCPAGWTVKKHKPGSEKYEFDPAQISLYQSKKQKKEAIDGKELHQELASWQFLNANVLDHLLSHQNLIPEKWKYKFIFFFGTIYLSNSGGPCVRCLRWNDHSWEENWEWLNSGLDDRHFAIVHKGHF